MRAFIYLSMVASITGVMGVVILFRRVSLFCYGARATGSFTNWKSRGARKVYYNPVVRFFAHDGKQYEFIGGPGITKKKERSEYPVIYPPAAPEKAMVLSLWAFWAAPPAFFILSVGTVVAALQHYPK